MIMMITIIITIIINSLFSINMIVIIMIILSLIYCITYLSYYSIFPHIPAAQSILLIQTGTNNWPQEILEMIITNVYFWQDPSPACGQRGTF